MAALAGAVVAGILVAIAVFKLMWRVAEPNEALIISGSRHHAEGVDEGMGFRIVTGRGSFVIPGVQVVRKLNLDLNEAELAVECVTKQGVPVGLRGVVIFKVGDDFVSIANAARRFLDQQKLMATRVHNVFAGHLRSIVGGLTVEELIRERDKLTEQTRAASGSEMEKLGLIIDSLQIQEIDDPTGYIKNLALPHTAAVERDARIAQAAADRQATEAEQDAAAAKAGAIREAQIRQAGYQAEMDQAGAKSRQAGPLADATARQQVVVQETRTAELEASLSEKRLQSQVRKPADAKAYETVTLAAAERDARIAAAEAAAKETELRAAADAQATRTRGEADAASTRVKGVAEADATKAQGLAEAEAIKARADALADNQEAVIAQQLATQWPEIVEAGTKAFANIDQMVVLNGADGMSEMFAKALTLGGAGLGLARTLMSAAKQDDAPAGGAASTNGASAAVPAAAPAVAVPAVAVPAVAAPTPAGAQEPPAAQ
jgi:flotillin